MALQPQRRPRGGLEQPEQEHRRRDEEHGSGGKKQPFSAAPAGRDGLRRACLRGDALRRRGVFRGGLRLEGGTAHGAEEPRLCVDSMAERAVQGVLSSRARERSV